MSVGEGGGQRTGSVIAGMGRGPNRRLGWFDPRRPLSLFLFLFLFFFWFSELFHIFCKFDSNQIKQIPKIF
jgi:hypothetical protein